MAEKFAYMYKNPHTSISCTMSEALQHLIDAVADFCGETGLVISVPKTKVLVFSQVLVTPFEWSCHGVQLDVVTEYLGALFAAQCGLLNTFGLLGQKMVDKWICL